ncbi:hypothetical protein BKA67DRAFT_244462 [Truncatella angustata]|uniref:Uncharacterized protein n=1 Tax=Truncatella angustata TaxID=152316 RepID=A0A9P8UPA7_9PEZI|nr:uncharacterized protein BKA67DRAFT_244462 [Truncatella angustata]KAH6655631.1 hypothetical protein BKA67DRAFT_244462 [Truncatella angustata]
MSSASLRLTDITHAPVWRTGATGILAVSYYALFGTATDAYLLILFTLCKKWQRGQQLSLPGYVIHSVLVVSVVVISISHTIWHRPERMQERRRPAHAAEIYFESIFRRYLRHLVSQTPAQLVVHYIPIGVADAKTETIRSRSTQEKGDIAEVLEFKILAPVFYTRFVCYAHDLEALFCELIESCTIWVSRPELLPKLVFKKPSPILNTHNPVEFAAFKLIQKLRKRPERIEQPLTSSQPPNHTSATHTKTDIRNFRLSSMDGYVLNHESTKARRQYRSMLLKLFVADRIALGNPTLLLLEQLTLAAMIAWFVAC